MRNNNKKLAENGVWKDFLDAIPLLIPQLSIDCVIFGFHNDELKVLLSKFHNIEMWALHGGFIQQGEDIDHAATRILSEHTSLTGIYLQQFQVFGKAGRQTFKYMESLFEALEVTPEVLAFFKCRFISIGYYALVDFSKVNPISAAFFEKSTWFDISELPELAFDHREIIQKALEQLRHALDYQLVGFNLMPETFTMNELQLLYETILGEKFLRANFQRKMLEMNILERMDKKQTGKGHKSPFLYRFKVA